jgi:Zn-dependent peptidase ImmA (M78 family)
VRTADKQGAIREARAARGALGVGLDAPLPDIVELLEDVAGIPIAVLPLPKDIAGACGKKSGRHFIFINSDDGPARRRFTLAHEYGHARLDHGGIVDLQTDIYGGGTSRRPPEEIEANYFASEFLAPVQAVRNWVDARGVEVFDLATVVRVGTYFGISAEAALIRLEEADVLPNTRTRNELAAAITDKKHHGLRERLGLATVDDTLSWFHLKQGETRVPRPVFARAKNAWEAGLVDLDRLARTIGTEPDKLRADLEVAGAVAPEVDEEDED